MVKPLEAFYYTCTIWRDNRQVLRQGTINATSDRDAIDKIHHMGQNLWKRTIISIDIIDPVTGVVLAGSKSAVDDTQQRELLPAIQTVLQKAETLAELQAKNRKERDKIAAEENKHVSTFVPWDQHAAAFVVSSIGTYFVPEKFPTITSFK